MNTVIAFLNNLNSDICELHCVVMLKSNLDHVEIAKMTVDFDKNFMGILKTREAFLVHFNIPVKGLVNNIVFSNIDLQCEIREARVAYSEENNEIYS